MCACTKDGPPDAGSDAGNALPLCGEASASIRYSFPGEAPVEVCAPLTAAGFTVVYSAAGLLPPMGNCTLSRAGAQTELVYVPGGAVYWWFWGYGTTDWFAHTGPVPLQIYTDLVTMPRDCPDGGASRSCRYVSYAGESDGCRFEVRQSGAARGDRVELVLAEPCPLVGVDRSVTAPTIEAMHVQSPIAIQTVNRDDPSQPPRFECPL